MTKVETASKSTKPRHPMQGDVLSDLAGISLRKEMLISCLVILIETETDYRNMDCWKVLQCTAENGKTLGYYLSNVKVVRVANEDIQKMKFLYNLASKLPKLDVLRNEAFKIREFVQNGEILDRYDEAEMFKKE